MYKRSVFTVSLSPLIVVLSLANISLAQVRQPDPIQTSSDSDVSSRPTNASRLRQKEIPLVFEPNRGQTSAEVRFLAHGNGYNLFLTDKEAVMAISPEETVCMRLSGARTPAHISGLKPTGGISNYFLGNDPKGWHTNVPHFRKIRYEGVYAGVDEVFYGNGSTVEYDFVVAPGADASQIAIEYDGARSLRVGEKGDLLLMTDAGEVRMHRPTVYQAGQDGNRTEIAAAFKVTGPRQASFLLARYDHAKELVIDPQLSYATYIGGSSSGDQAYGIAVDTAGNAYVAGVAVSSNFPLKNPLPSGSGVNQGAGNNDAFVSKLSADGTTLLYSTYLGGSGRDQASGIAVDSQGNAYVTGSAGSKDFPIQNALQPAWTGNVAPSFVTKLNPSGNGLVYSTFLGGKLGGTSYAIATDASGNAYVTGSTSSMDFPTTSGAFATAWDTSKGVGTAFLTKISSDGSAFVYSTFLGTNNDIGRTIAVDATGSAYVAGTPGLYFPTTPGSFQTVNQGSSMFVAKFNTKGSGLIYSTYLSGTRGSVPSGIAVDAAGDAYIVGSAGFDYPTKNPLYTSGAVVVSKLNPTGSGLIFSTFYMNGTCLTGQCAATGIALDAAGNAYISGSAGTTSIPVKNAIQPNIQSSRGLFLAEFSADGSALLLSTYLGGGYGNAIAVDANASVYIAGFSGGGLPTQSNVFQPALKGSSNAFVLKVSSASNAASAVNAASFKAGIAAPNSIASAFGAHLATQTLGSPATLGTNLGGTTVNITDANNSTVAAGLFFVSPGQVNFLVPAGLAAGIAQLQIVAGDGTVSNGMLQIANVTPGIFTADGTVAVGTALQVDGQGSQTTLNLAQYNAANGTFSATPINLGLSTTSTYLTLYGTGIRNALNSQISLSVGGQTVTPTFAGAQGSFQGLDQINLQIPHSLAGMGDVAITLTAAGSASNTVHIAVQ